MVMKTARKLTKSATRTATDIATSVAGKMMSDMTKARAIHEVVKVDYNVPGCPPDADVIFHVLSELAQGRKPELKDDLLHWH